MDTLKEILASLRIQAAERLANPLTGSFAIAWLLSNFRLLVVVFGDGLPEQKITYIDSMLYPSWKNWVLLGIVWPLIGALLYVFFYPSIAKRVIQFHRRRQREIREITMKVEGETPITQEAKAALLLKFRQAEQDWRNQRENLQEDIQTLEIALKQAQTQLKDRSKDLTTTSAPELEDGDEENLDALMGERSDLSGPKATLPAKLSVDSDALILGSVEAKMRIQHTGVRYKIAKVLDLMSESEFISIRSTANALGLLGNDAAILLKQMLHMELLESDEDGYLITDFGREVFQQLVESGQYKREEK